MFQPGGAVQPHHSSRASVVNQIRSRCSALGSDPATGAGGQLPSTTVVSTAIPACCMYATGRASTTRIPHGRPLLRNNRQPLAVNGPNSG